VSLLGMCYLGNCDTSFGIVETAKRQLASQCQRRMLYLRSHGIRCASSWRALAEMAKSVFGTSRLNVAVPLPFVPPKILTTNCKTNFVIMYSAIEADKTSRVDTYPSLLSDTVQASQLRTVSYSMQTHNWLE
jgi:hypothetical protein